MNQLSRCVFCSSTSYGKGCRYSTNGVHFHPDDPKKCSYCGSTSYGKGCRYSTNGVHIHGINYNSMLKERIEDVLTHKLLLTELKKPFIEFDAYRLGLINEKGNKIKEPVTEEENMALSPSNRTLFQIKRFLGSKVELIENMEILENQKLLNLSVEKYSKLLEYETKINKIFEEFHALIHEAEEDNISFEILEALIK